MSPEGRDRGGRELVQHQLGHFCPVLPAEQLPVPGRLRAFDTGGGRPGVTPQSFTLSARNSDVMPGFCAYAWLALAPFSTDRPPSPDLVIDSGVSCVSKYALTGTPGDTFRQEIYFGGPFLTPPLVFVLANDGQGQVPNPEKCRRRRHGPEHHPLRIHPGRPELRLLGRRGFPRLLLGGHRLRVTTLITAEPSGRAVSRPR